MRPLRHRDGDTRRAHRLRNHSAGQQPLHSSWLRRLRLRRAPPLRRWRLPGHHRWASQLRGKLAPPPCHQHRCHSHELLRYCQHPDHRGGDRNRVGDARPPRPEAYPIPGRDFWRHRLVPAPRRTADNPIPPPDHQRRPGDARVPSHRARIPLPQSHPRRRRGTGSAILRRSTHPAQTRCSGITHRCQPNTSTSPRSPGKRGRPSPADPDPSGARLLTRSAHAHRGFPPARVPRHVARHRLECRLAVAGRAPDGETETGADHLPRPARGDEHERPHLPSPPLV